MKRTEWIVSIANEGEIGIIESAKWVQELIRCKDCKNGEPGACGYGIDCDGFWHDDDWFCADGKRKEER